MFPFEPQEALMNNPTGIRPTRSLLPTTPDQSWTVAHDPLKRSNAAFHHQPTGKVAAALSSNGGPKAPGSQNIARPEPSDAPVGVSSLGASLVTNQLRDVDPGSPNITLTSRLASFLERSANTSLVGLLQRAAWLLWVIEFVAAIVESFLWRVSRNEVIWDCKLG